MIKANFNAYSSYVTDSVYQWDINRKLTVNGLNLAVAPEVHFSNANMDKAIVRQSTLLNHAVTVDIPNSLLQYPLTVKAHIGIYEGGAFKVVEVIEIPVIAKARPADYQIENSDEELYSFEALKNDIANMVKLSDFNRNNTAITARIDNIIAHNNDTDGNTELLDMRVGSDGKVHDSAGEAIRTQIIDANNKINDSNNGYERIKGDFVQGGLSLDGSVTDQKYYASHNEPISYDYDIRLRVKNGYSYTVFKQNADGVNYSGGSVTTKDTIIPKGTKFLLRIQTEPVTFNHSDVEVFSNQVYCESYIGNSANVAIKNNTNIEHLKNGDELLNGVFTWGSLSNGEWALWIYYRICTPDIVTYDRDIHIKVKSGFKFALHTFDENGTFVFDTSWRNHYTIIANTPFKMVIKRDTEDTSETADINEFVSAVYIHTAFKETVLSDRCNPFKKNYICRGKTPLVGHMGLRIRGDYSIPENTVASFEHAGKTGVWAMETDVRETRDGKFVCIHDDTLDRTTTGTGNVADKTLADIRNVYIKDVNGLTTEHRVPTIEEYLQVCKMYGVVPLIEIKDITSYSAFFDIIRKYGFMDNTMLTGGLWRLSDIRTYTDDMLYIVLPTETDYSLVYDTIKDYRCVGVSLLYTNETLTESIIEQMHEHNIFVQVWTLDDKEVIKSWLRKGVDAIVTDFTTSID